MLVRHLGLRPLREVLALKTSLMRRRGAGEVPDILLLAQHPAVYSRGEPLYHGPGQIAGYPIFHLRERDLTPRAFERSVEAVLIEALRPYEIAAARRRGRSGLWAGGRRIAEVSVSVRNGISGLSFVLNVNCDLAALHLVAARGDPGWTSMAEILGQPQDETQVAKAVAEAFLRYF
ncbi:MAG TPA: hypothetical protein DEB40_03990 [Elusimicrobia bacterium]|nr:hypothetical protein [Elusimicrobiota bacterium]HBT60888.1 hypothetical protein [Elusimicrobiota bacterium]